jgi:hypothetical protein
MKALPTHTAAALIALLAAGFATPAGAEQPVGAEFRVNTYTTGQQSYAGISRSPSGDFVVVWTSRDQDGDDFGIFGRRLDASGNALGDEFQVNTYTTGSQSEPAVSMDPSGGFVVAWTSWGQVGPWEDIIARRFDGSGTPIGGEFEVSTFTTQRQYRPDVASSPTGDFVIVWSGVVETGSFEIQGRRYAADGTPLGQEFRVNTYTTERQTRGVVSVDGEGSFVVSWGSFVSPIRPIEIYGQRFDASGARLGGEFRINAYTPGSQHTPAIAAHPSGDFVVAWLSLNQDGSDLGVFGRRFDATGEPLGEEFQVNSYTTGLQSNADVAMDAGGGFVVTWRSAYQDGSLMGVFAREFAPDGTPLGEEFQANTYTIGNQDLPAVGSDADGDFVIAWESGQAGGGIFARRYAGPGLFLSAAGRCPGNATVTILNGPPRTEVAVVAAANTNGFVKGPRLCEGTELEIGEPFQLPPVFVILDEDGAGTALLELAPNRCWIQALALADCQTSDTVRVSPVVIPSAVEGSHPLVPADTGTRAILPENPRFHR